MLESEFYNLFQSSKNDINFYVKMADKYSRGDVLEVGSGTGRILLELVKKGFVVDGLEPNGDRAGFCEKELSKFPENVIERAKVIRAFSNDYNPDKKYSLIILPFRVLQEMGDMTEQEKALKHLKGLLSPKGVLVFDIMYPALDLLAEFEKNISQPIGIKEIKDGNKVYKTSFVIRNIDKLKREFSAEREYELIEGDHREKLSYKWVSHYLMKGETEILLKKLGFDIIFTYGDFEMNNLEGYDEPKNMIFGVRNK